MSKITKTDNKVTEFEERVYEAVKKIPKGKVSTYILIAKAIGKPGAARAVGNALNRNPYAPASTRKITLNRGKPEVPCHRVVKSDGSVGGFAGGTKKKIRILKKEGIEIKDGKIKDIKKYLHKE